jgi:hypothetical protein
MEVRSSDDVEGCRMRVVTSYRRPENKRNEEKRTKEKSVTVGAALCAVVEVRDLNYKQL